MMDVDGDVGWYGVDKYDGGVVSVEGIFCE